MDTVQERIRYWRDNVKHLSLREFQRAVNEWLPDGETVSLGTVSNYERTAVDGGSRGGPRSDFLAAMKRAFPELRLAWLVLGQGEPTELAERLRLREGLEEGADEAASDSLIARVLGNYPDLDLLSPEASAMFAGALTRYAMGEPEMNLTEEHVIELAGDLRWLLLLPIAGWGFVHEPGYERFSGYGVAMLHALMLAMPDPGEGDPVADYLTSPVRQLRQTTPVGFQD